MLDFGSFQPISCILISRVEKYYCCSSQTGISTRGLWLSSLGQDLLFKCLAGQMCTASALAMDHILSIHRNDENKYCYPAQVQAQPRHVLYYNLTQSQSALRTVGMMTRADSILLTVIRNRVKLEKAVCCLAVRTELDYNHGCCKCFGELLGVMASLLAGLYTGFRNLQ